MGLYGVHKQAIPSIRGRRMSLRLIAVSKESASTPTTRPPASLAAVMAILSTPSSRHQAHPGGNNGTGDRASGLDRLGPGFGRADESDPFRFEQRQVTRAVQNRWSRNTESLSQTVWIATVKHGHRENSSL
jgi:hypothetical protein